MDSKYLDILNVSISLHYIRKLCNSNCAFLITTFEFFAFMYYTKAIFPWHNKKCKRQLRLFISQYWLCFKTTHLYITITRYTPSSHLTIFTFWPHFTTLRIESLSWMYILKGSYYAFTKSWFCFGGCTRTCSHDWWFKNHIMYYFCNGV